MLRKTFLSDINNPSASALSSLKDSCQYFTFIERNVLSSHVMFKASPL